MLFQWGAGIKYLLDASGVNYPMQTNWTSSNKCPQEEKLRPLAHLDEICKIRQ